MAAPATDFVENVLGIIQRQFGRELPAFTSVVIYSVETVDAHLYVRIRRIGATEPDPAYYKLLSSYTPVVGDVVLCARSGGTLVLLGKIVPYNAPGRFVSASLRSTGGQQALPHGLGTVPRDVCVAISGIPTASAVTTTEGAHDATNIYVTITPSGCAYRVMAWV